MQVEDDVSSPEVMLVFYKRLYPFKSIYNWLNHQHPPSRLFTHREFAFTLPGDVYIRYNSFDTAEDLKKQISRLNPSRFEIGAVYNAKPRDKRTLRPGILQPVQRELVFDIDMTDYDEIRTCCSGKGICRRCWGFISAAVKVLDSSLRDQFGFEFLLWVYSGRRGIHCWVSDDAALRLTDEQRKAIMGWLEVIKGGKEMARKVDVRMPKASGLHPSLQDALGILRHVFPDLILEDQDCFSVNDQSDILLELISDKEIVAHLRQKWTRDTARSSSEKWADLKREIKNRAQAGSKKSTANGDDKSTLADPSLEDIILQYTYPRLDSEVSKHRNHLLKAPFCVHPATGRVCVPIDPKHVEDFDPEAVPTVGQLLRELNDIKFVKEDVKMEDASVGVDAGEATQTGRSDWERTSLKPYVEMLDRHVLSLMNELRRVKREAGKGSLEF